MVRSPPRPSPAPPPSFHNSSRKDPPSQPRKQAHAPIERERGPVDKRAGPPAQEQARAGGILRRADAAERVRLRDRIPSRVEDSTHHLGRKRPASKSVNRDPARAQRHSKCARQMVQPGLGGAVGVVLHGRDAEGVDAADVDDARGGGRGRCLGALLLEQRDEQLRQGEDALEVEGQQLRPGGVRVRLEGLPPCRARVVDEHV